ncbi:MAG: hypothetical protein Edafosvirus2_49 [Edafosvirus sp.]|uniref:Uncharacterized protein n=1 Tax=Edafosvirus sp. TaxID=2487765 RepID=A0A3G4ZSJ2_9VIRU|nr:MAG: hypothetical protein Edafosvirus2_49 [Edafosvirus sp.]
MDQQNNKDQLIVNTTNDLKENDDINDELRTDNICNTCKKPLLVAMSLCGHLCCSNCTAPLNYHYNINSQCSECVLYKKPANKTEFISAWFDELMSYERKNREDLIACVMNVWDKCNIVAQKNVHTISMSQKDLIDHMTEGKKPTRLNYVADDHKLNMDFLTHYAVSLAEVDMYGNVFETTMQSIMGEMIDGAISNDKYMYQQSLDNIIKYLIIFIEKINYVLDLYEKVQLILERMKKLYENKFSKGRNLLLTGSTFSGIISSASLMYTIHNRPKSYTTTAVPLVITGITGLGVGLGYMKIREMEKRKRKLDRSVSNHANDHHPLLKIKATIVNAMKMISSEDKYINTLLIEKITVDSIRTTILDIINSKHNVKTVLYKFSHKCIPVDV